MIEVIEQKILQDFKELILERYGSDGSSYRGPLCIAVELDYYSLYPMINKLLDDIGIDYIDYEKLYNHFDLLIWNYFDDHIVGVMFEKWGEPLTLDDI